ncbi:substrate-binding domain-containing protein [Curtobacterium sp. ZW137]|uniref:substrate-binding domain-containing protein n=1 Tax=Curtobacterium sp. ZW137 TaxID=2485104 RepID=UPI000F4AFC61|nr:substrate-binding domain-containing protein [Curtobacterium sp. ZW137]ROP58545.1 monosaccharide ABC transporter substrate-binding protein (CUT2 family) [Curtobacterium sp. ZW137]
MFRSKTTSVLAAASAIGIAVVLAGCSTGSTAAAGDASSSGKKTIAMVTPESTGEFYGTMYCGAKAAAKKEGVTLKIQGTPETTTDAEMQVLQSVLATNPDGLLLTVWDNTAFNSTLKSYTDSGKPLVMPDSFLSNKDYVQSIRTDNYQSSYDAAVQAIKDFKLTSGKVVIVTDSPGNQVQSDRAKGFKDAIEKESKLTALDIQYVGGDSAKASQTVSSQLSANSDVKLVFSTNIGAGTGAANAISSSGKDDIVHVGYDTASNQVASLKKGEYDALVAQDPYTEGYEATELMAKLVNGDTKADDVTKQTVYSPWKLVTQDNVDDADVKKYLYSTDCSALG